MTGSTGTGFTAHPEKPDSAADKLTAAGNDAKAVLPLRVTSREAAA
ncbi:hypothetical protein ACIGZJ_17670 [Kitasatospora sp. NPDC052868]